MMLFSAVVVVTHTICLNNAALPELSRDQILKTFSQTHFFYSISDFIHLLIGSSLNTMEAASGQNFC